MILQRRVTYVPTAGVRRLQSCFFTATQDAQRGCLTSVSAAALRAAKLSRWAKGSAVQSASWVRPLVTSAAA